MSVLAHNRRVNREIDWCSPRFSLGPATALYFVNDLPAIVKFDNPFLFADDFKHLAHGNLETEFQYVLEQVARWVKENKMELAPNKCFQLVIKGDLQEPSNSVIDLGVVVNTSLTWSEHLDKGLKKTNKVLLYLRQNLLAK